MHAPSYLIIELALVRRRTFHGHGRVVELTVTGVGWALAGRSGVWVVEGKGRGVERARKRKTDREGRWRIKRRYSGIYIYIYIRTCRAREQRATQEYGRGHDHRARGGNGRGCSENSREISSAGRAGADGEQETTSPGRTAVWLEGRPGFSLTTDGSVMNVTTARAATNCRYAAEQFTEWRRILTWAITRRNDTWPTPP